MNLKNIFTLAVKKMNAFDSKVFDLKSAFDSHHQLLLDQLRKLAAQKKELKTLVALLDEEDGLSQ